MNEPLIYYAIFNSTYDVLKILISRRDIDVNAKKIKNVNILNIIMLLSFFISFKGFLIFITFYLLIFVIMFNNKYILSHFKSSFVHQV